MSFKLGSVNKRAVLLSEDHYYDLETISEGVLSSSSSEALFQIDKLIIDVEGSEYEILKDIDFGSINISKIIFEYKHFDGFKKTGNKLNEILSKLKENNYTSSKIDEENILAVKT